MGPCLPSVRHTDHPLLTRCIGCQLSSQQKHFGAVIITASFSHAVFIIWPHTLLDVFPAAPPFYSAFVMTGTSYWKLSKVAVYNFFSKLFILLLVSRCSLKTCAPHPHFQSCQSPPSSIQTYNIKLVQV